tara:strand:+ start:223 stop:549 length:327 start_codon:yes stop_codon:yes gene_type:complete
MTDEIMIVRLTTGEEVLAKVTETDGTYTLKNPAILVPTGEGKIAIAPWCFYSDEPDGINVRDSFVVFTAKPENELRNQYSSAFGSGLVVPETPKVAGVGGVIGSIGGD